MLGAFTLILWKNSDRAATNLWFLAARHSAFLTATVGGIHARIPPTCRPFTGRFL